jgi:hypothetical protein
MHRGVGNVIKIFVKIWREEWIGPLFVEAVFHYFENASVALLALSIIHSAHNIRSAWVHRVRAYNM